MIKFNHIYSYFSNTRALTDPASPSTFTYTDTYTHVKHYRYIMQKPHSDRTHAYSRILAYKCIFDNDKLETEKV